MSDNTSSKSPPLPPLSDKKPITTNPNKIILHWAILLLYVGFIWLTLARVPDWREWVAKHYGDHAFFTLTLSGAIFLLLLILGVMIFKHRQKKITAYLSLVGIFGTLYYLMRHWISIPSEQIHFVEYGLVGYLSFHALRQHLSGWALVAVALLLAYFFGMVDETIQGNLANRVGEQRDMYTNGLANALGLAVVVFALRSSQIWGRRSGRKELITALLILLAALPVQGYFNTDIAQFGRLIDDKARGVVFRSRLTGEQLRKYDDHLEYFRTQILPRAGRERMAVLRPQVHDMIHEEALVHLFRRGQYYRSGNYPVAYKESLILSGYFPQFVAGTEHDWSGEIMRQLQETIGAMAFSTYESPVAGHLITKFTEWQMWGVIALLEAGFIFILLRLRKRTVTNVVA